MLVKMFPTLGPSLFLQVIVTCIIVRAMILEDKEEHLKSEGDYDHMGFNSATYLKDESKIPLFFGSKWSKLDTTLMFLHVCHTYKITNAYLSEFLHLFSKNILPSPNLLPTSEEIAITMLNRLGLKNDTIDDCEKWCVLFRHEYAVIKLYLICHASRFKLMD